MTILQSLNGYYDRMAARHEVEHPGFSREKISFAIVLSADGEPVDVLDLRAMSGRKLQPVLRAVPAAVKRTAGILPNRFWDKSSYVLGRTAGEGRRTVEEHAAFKALHRDLLGGSNDEGLVALLRFLERWQPQAFADEPFNPEMLDANIVFRLDGDDGFIHEREAARRILEEGAAAVDAPDVLCLVTGTRGPMQRLHPSIKGVQGAQTAGAALVSFNLDAFTSYDKEQGANAPTSQAAALRYGAALNRMLNRGSANRLARPVGDATVAFWADTSATISEEAAEAAEAMVRERLEAEPADDDPQETAKLGDMLAQVAAGRPQAVHPGLRPGTRFHVLGLSPNAARLSVRYWFDDTFETFAQRLLDHERDLQLEPRPWKWGNTPPSVARLLVRTTALQEKFDNIPPLLAGEVMRAVLGGTRYPRLWLAAALMRLRAGDDPSTGWHAAAIRAVLERDRRLAPTADRTEEIPVSLAKDSPDEAYQLGRLFAALEIAQRMALGPVNATIRDRYFGAASATPASVFPLLLRGVQNHIGKLRKERKDAWIEREITEIVGHLPDRLPRILRLEAQGRFAIGFYHQRRAQFAKRQDGATPDTPDEQTEDGEGEDHG